MTFNHKLRNLAYYLTTCANLPKISVAAIALH